MALETQGSKEHGLKYGREQGARKRNLGAGSTKIWKKEQRAAKNWEMEQGARGKIKKEQGAKRYEKGAVKIGKKEQAPKTGREQGERGKM